MNDIKEIKKVVAENVKKYRSLHDLSQRALAKKANVDSRMISRIESVDYTFTPSITTLIKIANVFKIPLSKLISDSPSELSVQIGAEIVASFKEGLEKCTQWMPIKCDHCRQVGLALKKDISTLVICPFCGRETPVLLYYYSYPEEVK